ncbi:MAG: 16S rRNA (adenine(1518)-N(6)/adenine(1519)-N(6))-dimethyltransferase RsmA, partial [Fimbriimonadaceae bacterium]
HGVYASKRYSQNFLVSDRVLGNIVRALEGASGVLEIGPGPGSLTQRLLEAGFTVSAIELDQRMIPVLQETAPLARVSQGDALKVDWAPFLSGLPEPRAICGNLPYGITGPLLGKIQEVHTQITKAVVMVQREVMERMMAKEGSSERSALSAWIQLYFVPKLVCAVPPGSFMPPPKVNSSVVELTPRPETESEELLMHAHQLIKTGFRMPRKTLANNLATDDYLTRTAVESVLEELGLSAAIRPQQVSREQWLNLAKMLPQQND